MDDYTRKIEELKSSLVYAYQSWEIWWFIRNEKYNYKKVFNKYLLFFTYSQVAHFVTAIISTWHLIDDKHISVENLYKELCNENLLSNTVKHDIEDRFKSIEHVKKGIVIIRHNVVAHISKKIDAIDAFEKAKIEGMDIRNMIVQLGNILNIIIDSMGGTPLAFTLNSRADKPGDVISENDVKKLFVDLEQIIN